MVEQLFEIPPLFPTAFCRTCIHRQPTQRGGYVFQYCGARKSNRTDNGKLKIKCKTPACNLYEKVSQKQK